MMKEGQYE